MVLRYIGLCCLLSLSLSVSHTQNAKGDWLTGGSFSYSSTSSETVAPNINYITTDNNFGINAFGAYFIANKLAIGAGFGWSHRASTNNYEPLEVTDVNTIFSTEALARYYFYEADVFQLWVGAGARLGWGNYDDHAVELDSVGNNVEVNEINKITTSSFGIGPGAAIKLTPKLSLDIYLGSLGYSTYKFKNEDGTYNYESTSLGFTFAQNFGFGLTYRF